MDVGHIKAQVEVEFRGKSDAREYEATVKKLRRLAQKDVKTKVEAKTDTNSFRRATHHLNQLDKNAKNLRGGFLGAATAASGMSRGMLAASAGAAGLTAAFIGVKTSVNKVEDLAKATKTLMRTMRVGEETGSQWAELLDSYGVSAQQAGIGFARLNKNMIAASGGSKPMADAFKTLGINSKQLKTMGIEDVILQTSKAFKNGVPSAQASAAALTVFGRNYRSLLPILGRGANGIKENLAQIKHYGAYLTKDGVRTAGQYASAQREMKYAFDGLKIAVGTQVMPEIVKFIPRIRELMEGFRGHGPMKGFADGLKTVGKAIVSATVFIGELTSTKEGLVAFFAAIAVAMTLAMPEIVAIGAAILAIKTAIDLVNGTKLDAPRGEQTDPRKTPKQAREDFAAANTPKTADTRAMRRSFGNWTQVSNVLGAENRAAIRGNYSDKQFTQMMGGVHTAVGRGMKSAQIIKILGDDKDLKGKLRELGRQKIAPKTGKLKGDSSHFLKHVSEADKRKLQGKTAKLDADPKAANSKIDAVDKKKIAPKTAKVDASGNAWSQVGNLL